MKRILTLFVLFCLFLTACGTDEHSAENVSETEATKLDIQTVTDLNITEPVTELPVAETEAETLSITAAPSETESVSAGDTQTIGDEDYGYLEVSSDWKYEEPMVVEVPSIEYTDGKGNSIFIHLHAEWGADGQYIYSDESIDNLAERCYEAYNEFKNNAKLEKLENSAPIAYKLTYTKTVRTDDGRGEVSYGDKYYSVWLLDFADGTKRSVTFSGDEEFVKNSDDIIKTYHLGAVQE